jgi:hypothetical protein
LTSQKIYKKQQDAYVNKNIFFKYLLTTLFYKAKI